VIPPARRRAAEVVVRVVRVVWLRIVCVAVLAGACVPGPPGAVRPPGTQATPDDGRLPAFGEYVHADQLPVAVSTVQPVYPEEARQARVEGTVMVQALVGKDGFVKDARVTGSIPALDDAALEAVRQWVFSPATSQGLPVAVWVAVPVRFQLP
jgi:protein TonB